MNKVDLSVDLYKNTDTDVLSHTSLDLSPFLCPFPSLYIMRALQVPLWKSQKCFSVTRYDENGLRSIPTYPTRLPLGAYSNS